MARRRRRNRNFIGIPVTTQLALGTLGDGVVSSANITQFGTTKFKVVSTDLTWTSLGATPTEGPIQVGIGNADLSNTEMGEALDAQPTSKADIVALERIRRPVREVGAFAVVSANDVLNDGKPIRQKLVTVLDEGIELDVWARNKSGATLTTGHIITVTGRVYGYWL